MRAGDVLEITIDRLGAQGDGLAYHGSGKTMIYVPLALAGERVKVRLGPPVGNGFSSRLLEVLTPSAERVAPACRYFERCGGCAVQHLTAPAYQAWKMSYLRSTLAHFKLGETPLRELVSLPAASRRRLSLVAMADKAGKVFLGFSEKASHQIVDIQSCEIAHPDLVAVLPLVREALTPWLKKARTLSLLLTKTESGLDLVVTGPEPDLASRETITLLGQWKEMARISWRKRLQDEPEPMVVIRSVTQTVGGVVVSLPAGGFLQPSQEGQEALTGFVLEATSSEGPIVELFAGSGTFSFPLGQKGPVTAFESDKAAVASLNLAAQRGGTPHQVRGLVRDLFRDPVQVSELIELAPETVVLDPPRAGAEAQCREVAQAQVPTVVMVSCNPSTFGRDAGCLLEAGYRCEWIQPVDQFVWSAHLELVGKFLL